MCGRAGLDAIDGALGRVVGCKVVPLVDLDLGLVRLGQGAVGHQVFGLPGALVRFGEIGVEQRFVVPLIGRGGPIVDPGPNGTYETVIRGQLSRLVDRLTCLRKPGKAVDIACLERAEVGLNTCQFCPKGRVVGIDLERLFVGADGAGKIAGRNRALASSSKDLTVRVAVGVGKKSGLTWPDSRICRRNKPPPIKARSVKIRPRLIPRSGPSLSWSPRSCMALFSLRRL